MAAITLTDDIRRRFWSKVDMSGECWEWTAAKQNGYGCFWLRRGVPRRAHKFSYEMSHGPTPRGAFVFHLCDNPLCVRPDHLSLACRPRVFGRPHIRQGVRATDVNSPEEAKVRLYERTVLSDEESCWIWVGGTSDDGYGSIKVNGKTHRAHRLSYEAHVGPIPKGMFVCHKCDVRRCVNPYHLFLGTNEDNVADMVQKGRVTRLYGDANGGARLTGEQVKEVQRLREEGWTYRAIGESFGVHRETIRYIVAGKSWRGVSHES